MPIYNGAQGLSAPDPRALFDKGPVLDVEVDIPHALKELLMKTGKPVPSPVVGVALVDTGATLTAVDEAVMRHLGVSPIGKNLVGTANGPVEQGRYPACLVFPTFPPEGMILEFSGVTGVNLMGASSNKKPIIALLGRDFLSHCVLVYNGTTGHFSISR